MSARAMPDKPIPQDGLTLTRYRYVNGPISAKCDRESAYRVAGRYGGRVDVATITAYPDGQELLGAWSQVWPPVEGDDRD